MFGQLCRLFYEKWADRIKRSQSAIAELAPFSLNGQFTGRAMLRMESYTAGRKSVPSDFIRPHLFELELLPGHLETIQWTDIPFLLAEHNARRD